MKKLLRSARSLLQKNSRQVRPVLFVAVFAAIGVAALMYTRAATPTASLEPENGTLTAGACTSADATASNGSRVAFGSCGGGGSLPAGVSLQEIDGGQTYFEQWPNTFPSAQEDPTFFPIAVFNAFDLGGNVGGKTKAVAFKETGINTFVGLYNGALADNPKSLDVVKANGMYAIHEPDQSYFNTTFNNTYGSTSAGYVYQDELEGNPCSSGTLSVDWLRPYCFNDGDKIDTLSLVNMTTQVKNGDGNRRPVYQGFTHSFIQGFINTNNTSSDPIIGGDAYAHIVAGSDIIGYDVYGLVDRRFSYYTAGKVWSLHQTVTIARNNIARSTGTNGTPNNRSDDPRVFTKPIWPDIETSEVDTFNTSCYRPTGADVQALVWNGIIAGARGITYFNNNFASNCSSPLGSDIFLKPAFADIKAAMTTVNGRVKNLAPVINSKFANGYETHTGQINTMVKYCNTSGIANCNGKFYIFAAPKASGSQNVTFTLAGVPSGTATVVDENRSVPITNGQFTDSFANDTTVHIYRID